MIYKALILSALLLLDSHLLSGQTIHYDYDDSGNRQIRYIVLNKGNTPAEETSKEYKDNIKAEEYEDKQEEFTIRIYPNPTRGTLTVKITGLQSDETVSYQLFSQTGLRLIEKNKTGHQFSIEMDRFPSGLYILKLVIQDKISQWKILKE